MSKSSRGRKHTEETKKLIRLATKAICRTVSEETKALIRLARLGKPHISEEAKSKMSEERGTAVRVLDLKTNETSVYTSTKKAAEAMGVAQTGVSRRLKKSPGSIIVKKRYQVEKVDS